MTNKRASKNILTTKGRSEMMLVCCLMRSDSSQIGIYTQQWFLIPSLPLSLALIMCSGNPRALCWKTVIGGDDNLPTDPEFVQDMLLQLDVHKSMGPDGIHPRVPKELTDVNAGPLSIIFQVTWESGEVPVDWKLANIVPISRRERRKTLIIQARQSQFTAW